MWIEPYLVVGQGGKYITADRANRFAVEIANKVFSTDPLAPDTDEAILALRSVRQAEEEIRRAEQDGRTQQSDRAKQKLVEAIDPFSSGKYGVVVSLAKEALELVGKASASTANVTSRTSSETTIGSSVANYGMVGVVISVLAIAVAAIVVALSLRKVMRGK
jgi:hypothetical protein